MRPPHNWIQCLHLASSHEVKQSVEGSIDDIRVHSKTVQRQMAPVPTDRHLEKQISDSHTHRERSLPTQHSHRLALVPMISPVVMISVYLVTLHRIQLSKLFQLSMNIPSKTARFHLGDHHREQRTQKPSFRESFHVATFTAGVYLLPSNAAVEPSCMAIAKCRACGCMFLFLIFFWSV